MTAERTVSRAMGGSCSMPLAAFTVGPAEGRMQLEAAWGDPVVEGVVPAALPKPLVRAVHSAAVTSFAEAEALGEAVAAQLQAHGAVWASDSPAG